MARLIASLCLLAVLLLAANAVKADDRPAIYLAQVAAFANRAEEAEKLVRCGIRDRGWADYVEFRVSSRTLVLAFRLWPKAKTDDIESDAFQNALAKAHEIANASNHRGQQVAAQWCVNTAPEKASVLDEFSRDTSYFIYSTPN